MLSFVFRVHRRAAVGTHSVLSTTQDAYQTNATTVLVNIGASHAQSRPYADGPLCVDVVVIGVGAG
jgi:hypothetical protein